MLCYIQVGWNDLKAAFGAANVLVVSNSAGTKKDPGGIAVRPDAHYLLREISMADCLASGRVRL